MLALASKFKHKTREVNLSWITDYMEAEGENCINLIFGQTITLNLCSSFYYPPISLSSFLFIWCHLPLSVFVFFSALCLLRDKGTIELHSSLLCLPVITLLPTVTFRPRHTDTFPFLPMPTPPPNTHPSSTSRLSRLLQSPMFGSGVTL